MARTGGIQYSDVANACAAIEARGQTPTIMAIRAEHGSGSFSTISQHLAKWRVTEGSAVAVDPLPAELEDGALELINRFWTLSSTVSARQIATMKTAHAVEIAQLTSELRDAMDEIARLEKSLESKK